jgi:hypothetical protein
MIDVERVRIKGRRPRVREAQNRAVRAKQRFFKDERKPASRWWRG